VSVKHVFLSSGLGQVANDPVMASLAHSLNRLRRSAVTDDEMIVTLGRIREDA
jgi:hypothetical protein